MGLGLGLYGCRALGFRVLWVWGLRLDGFRVYGLFWDPY